MASARAPATGSGTAPPVESAFVPLVALRGPAASASGEVSRERPPLGGLNLVLAETQRTEEQLQRLQRKLAALDEQWQQAMAAEAQALNEETAAREAVESCVLGTGEGGDVQGVLIAAVLASTEAGGAVDALAAKKRAIEGAIARSKEENRRAGEDTRNEQVKRKRRPEAPSDGKNGGTT